MGLIKAIFFLACIVLILAFASNVMHHNLLKDATLAVYNIGQHINWDNVLPAVKNATTSIVQ